MKYTIYTLLLLFISTNGFSQDSFEKWNERYTKINFTDLMRFETAYADSVDRGIIEGKYYARYDR